METLKPLMDQLALLIAKAGGKADQVWPELVSNYWVGSFIVLLSTSFLGFGALVLSLYILFHAKKYSEDCHDVSPYIAGWAILFVSLLILCVGCYESLPGVLYPEGGLIREFGK